MTVDGIDVSVYQGTIDWARVRRAGVEFAIIRVSNGTGTFDVRFDANWAGAAAAGVRRGVYQYFRPGQDPLAQADFLLDHMGALAAGDLPPAIDIETTDGKTGPEIAAAARVWLDRVEAATGRVPIIYSGLYFWRDQVGGGAEFARYPLWIPQYGPVCPTLPPPWTDWVFFQYSSKGTIDGISGDVDLDRFNGDAAALERFAAATAPADAGVPAAPDAGAPPDGAPPAPLVDGDVTGGCSAAPGTRPPIATLLIAALLLALRRRA